MDQSPQVGIVLRNQFGNPLYWHGRSHYHNVGFKQQSKPSVSPGPRNIDHPDTTITALDMGYPIVYECFVLEKNQMSPRFFSSVMDSTVFLSAIRTGEMVPPEKVQIIFRRSWLISN
jgi:hypothetical protein